MINSKKSKAMILGTSRYLGRITGEDLPKICVDGTVVPFSDTVEYLGVTISNSLSWDKQVKKMVSKVSFVFYQQKLCRHLLPFHFE